MQVIKSYIKLVRPLLKPQCDFVAVARNGGQHSKLGDVMSKLVFDAIGKFIHPMHYRQIVEMQSLNLLTSKEQQILSEDQKHGSAVAKVHYQKTKIARSCCQSPRVSTKATRHERLGGG